MRPGRDARPPSFISLLGSQRRLFRSYSARGSPKPRCRLVVAAVVHALKAVAQSRARAEFPQDSTSIAVNDDARREGLEQVLDQLRPCDTLLVWKLDRLGRLLRHLVDTVTGLAERGIGCRSLQETLDTTTPGGKPPSATQCSATSQFACRHPMGTV